MSTHILAKDIMVTKLVTLTPDMGLRVAAKLLLKNKISGAPVVDEQGALLGVFSEKDVMTALIDAVYDDLPDGVVGSYMQDHPKTITEDLDLLSIVHIFKNEPYRRLAVVRGEKLVGQISRRDVMSAVMKLIEPAKDRQTVLLYLSALKEQDEVSFE